jgi:hypothetical protein
MIHTEYKPASFAIAVVYNSGLGLDLIDCEYHHAGVDTVKLFFERIFYHARKILTYIRATNKSAVPSTENLEEYRLSKSCIYCKRDFTQGYGITYANDVSDVSDFDLDDEELDKLFQDDFDDEDISEAGKKDAPHLKNKEVRKVWHHQHQDGSWLGKSSNIFYIYKSPFSDTSTHFVGPTCSRCNMYQRANHTVNVIGMNSTRFDNHLLISGFASGLFSTESVRVIARSTEEYVEIEITLNENVSNVGKSNIKNKEKAACGNRKVKVRFIDCLNFLVGSLSAQVDALRAENNPNFSLVKDAFPFMLSPGSKMLCDRQRAVVNLANFDEESEESAANINFHRDYEFPNFPKTSVRPTKENIDLLLQKLPYAYSYLDCSEKLNDDTPMPARCF